MKKDKIISEQLNKIIQDIRPVSHRLLAPAKTELINRTKQKKKSPWLIIGGLAATYAMILFIVIFGVFNYFQGINKNGNVLQSYSISSLSIKHSSEIDDDRILSPDYEKMTISYNTYSYSDELVMYGIRYRIVTDHGTDIILVYTDLKRGLKDYREVRQAQRYTVRQDIVISKHQKYENGEFYTHAFYSNEKADYYIFIMSPDQLAEIKHLQSLLK